MKLRFLRCILLALVASAFTTPAAYSSGGTLLGVIIGDLSQDLCEEWNAGDISGIEHGVVLYVRDNTPAQTAGLITGDILVRLNGIRIVDPDEVYEIVQSSSPGDVFTADILRQKQPMIVSRLLGSSEQQLGE